MATGHEVEGDRLGAKQVNRSLLAPAPIGTFGFEAAEVNAPEYDLVVIGSGPAGQKGAIAAGSEERRVGKECELKCRSRWSRSTREIGRAHV